MSDWSMRGRVLLAAVVGASASAVLSGNAGAAGAYSPPARLPPLVSLGFAHSLAVTPSGTVRAWGANGHGQLGDASTTSTTVPLTVIGFSGTSALTHVVAVAAAEYRSYAVLANGTVAAWGNNTDGSLGDGTTTDTTRPVHVVSTSGTGQLSGVDSVVAGYGHALALRTDGTVLAWGFDGDGELGNGGTSSSSIPVPVHGPTSGVLGNIVAIAAGESDSYALTSTGTVYAWGDATAIGTVSDTTSTVPVPVSGVGGTGVLDHVVSIAAGEDFAFALRSDGTVVSWGQNSNGELGIGSTTAEPTPVLVTALGDHIAAIGGGESTAHGLAVGANGSVYSWGYNSDGGLGDGDATSAYSDVPVRVSTLSAGSGVVEVAAGAGRGTALTSSGVLYDWGRNANSELGDGTEVDSLTPTKPYSLGAISAPALVVLSAPVLGGHARRGYTLTVTHGTWGLPASAYGYRWYRDGHPIHGATHASFRVPSTYAGHRVSVLVNAARSGYRTGRYSSHAILIRR